MNVDPSDVIHHIAVSSQKGGVAKTTTCLSLGASLVELGKRVLLVDLDPQAHLTQALSINPEGLRRTIGDALLYQATLLEVSRESTCFSLDIVPSNRGLILVEKLLQNNKGYEFHLKNNLETLDGHYYDVVLFDCPPSFGPLTVNALAASDLVIIPVTCDYFSMQSLQSYLTLLNVVRRNINPGIKYRMLVTLYDGRTRLSKLILENFRGKYGAYLFETIIPVDVKIRESPLFGRPITFYATNARSALEYRSLARELMSCLEMTI